MHKLLLICGYDIKQSRKLDNWKVLPSAYQDRDEWTVHRFCKWSSKEFKIILNEFSELIFLWQWLFGQYKT